MGAWREDHQLMVSLTRTKPSQTKLTWMISNGRIVNVSLDSCSQRWTLVCRPIHCKPVSKLSRLKTERAPWELYQNKVLTVMILPKTTDSSMAMRRLTSTCRSRANVTRSPNMEVTSNSNTLRVKLRRMPRWQSSTNKTATNEWQTNRNFDFVATEMKKAFALHLLPLRF